MAESGMTTERELLQALDAALAQPAQVVALTFTLREAEELLHMFGGEQGEITVLRLPEGAVDDDPDDPASERQSPAGLYGHMTDYPEEGCVYLGPVDVLDDYEPEYTYRAPQPAPAAPSTLSAPELSDAPKRDAWIGGNSYEASMLRNLLARIHGDGGHYLEAHGLEKALDDADQLVSEWRAGRAPVAEDAARWQIVGELVDRQAEDEGLWFVAQTAPEDYLQRELRYLHAAIDAARGKP